MTSERVRATNKGRRRLRMSVLALLWCLFPVTVYCEIYQYQDGQGSWHFTDDPPDGSDSSVVPGISTSKGSSRTAGPTEDLADRLQSAYNPITPIAYATLAVVSIKTGSGEGSGFFCSEAGHILTTKQVVRPIPPEGGDGRDGSAGGSKEELRKSRWGLGGNRGIGMADTRFDLVLKDGTELVARLLDTSDNQDLALLKVDGYRTPFLRLDPSKALSQGTRVFAIGSPLGMQDTVTSGVLTRVAPEHLLTDAQILPGSSGGPLIRESGEVIGINAARKVAAGASMYAAGFGKAIPIALAVREFPDATGSTLIESVGRGASGASGRGGEEGFGSGPTGGLDPSGVEIFVPDRALNIGLGGTGSFGSRQDGAFRSAPVRLILPDEAGDSGVDASTEPAARSLDFPPEGGGIPPGISWPRE